jgi:DDE superfamily endonuclease
MMFAPLEGWRHIEITDRRTAIDYARALEDLSDRHFPNAKKIVLVQDNLNTHKPASLYEAFPPDKARRLVERFEWHYTPKHGSWLDMAESELAYRARSHTAWTHKRHLWARRNVPLLSQVRHLYLASKTL